MLFYGPSGAGKKTRISCTLRQLFGGGVEKVRICRSDGKSWILMCGCAVKNRPESVLVPVQAEIGGEYCSEQFSHRDYPQVCLQLFSKTCRAEYPV